MQHRKFTTVFSQKLLMLQGRQLLLLYLVFFSHDFGKTDTRRTPCIAFLSNLWPLQMVHFYLLWQHWCHRDQSSRRRLHLRYLMGVFQQGQRSSPVLLEQCYRGTVSMEALHLFQEDGQEVVVLLWDSKRYVTIQFEIM